MEDMIRKVNVLILWRSFSEGSWSSGWYDLEVATRSEVFLS
jgi:hypothetical protein